MIWSVKIGVIQLARETMPMCVFYQLAKLFRRDVEN